MVSLPRGYFKSSLSKANQAFSLQITPLPSVSPSVNPSSIRDVSLVGGWIQSLPSPLLALPPPSKHQCQPHARHAARYWVYEIKEQSQSRPSCSGHYQATLYHKGILTSPSILKSPPQKQTSKITCRLYPETLYHLTLTYFSRLISKFTLSTLSACPNQSTQASGPLCLSSLTHPRPLAAP